MNGERESVRVRVWNVVSVERESRGRDLEEKCGLIIFTKKEREREPRKSKGDSS